QAPLPDSSAEAFVSAAAALSLAVSAALSLAASAALSPTASAGAALAGTSLAGTSLAGTSLAGASAAVASAPDGASAVAALAGAGLLASLAWVSLAWVSLAGVSLAGVSLTGLAALDWDPALLPLSLSSLAALRAWLSLAAASKRSFLSSRGLAVRSVPSAPGSPVNFCQSPVILSRTRTGSVGCAPTESQCCTRSEFTSMNEGSAFGG